METSTFNLKHLHTRFSLQLKMEVVNVWLDGIELLS